MNTLLIRCGGIWVLIIVETIGSMQLHASIFKAAVTVTATTSSSVNSTALTTDTNSTVAPNQPSACPASTPSLCNQTSTGACNRGVSLTTLWNIGSFPIVAGTHTYHLNIDTTSSSAGNLDNLLCGNGPCNVCFCVGDNNGTTTTSGTCSASSGWITPTCTNGHVSAITSSLTLTCP